MIHYLWPYVLGTSATAADDVWSTAQSVVQDSGFSWQRGFGKP